MTSVLEKICADKQDHIALKKNQVTKEELLNNINDAPKPIGFIKKIKEKRNNKKAALIAEVKKASPSKGIIRDPFDPLDIAANYKKGGASCLSVLTDEKYFQGHDDYFSMVRKESSLPMLRKDFIIDPYQIYETRALGADCVLLIVAALSPAQYKDLYDLSAELGMDVLVEVHNEEELNTALTITPEMVGVNNRNLKTLEVDVHTSFTLKQMIPENIVTIAESGISDHSQLSSLFENGYDGFLVGEGLCRQKDIEKATLDLLGSLK